MISIGCVLYRKGEEPGTLLARWFHSNSESGTGKAIGGSSDGFAGRYHIQYSNDKSNEISAFELVIEKVCDYYELSWIENDNVRFRGIGMEVSEGLFAGWRSVID